MKTPGRFSLPRRRERIDKLLPSTTPRFVLAAVWAAQQAPAPLYRRVSKRATLPSNRTEQVNEMLLEPTMGLRLRAMPIDRLGSAFFDLAQSVDYMPRNAGNMVHYGCGGD